MTQAEREEGTTTTCTKGRRGEEEEDHQGNTAMDDGNETEDRDLWPHQRASLRDVSTGTRRDAVPASIRRKLAGVRLVVVCGRRRGVHHAGSQLERSCRAEGVLADWAGSGKTATALRHCTRHVLRPARDGGAGSGGEFPLARGTLVIVPLNVIAQWEDEAARWCHASVCRLSTLGEWRASSASELCSADVVLTTFEFLRDSRSYAHAVEERVMSVLGVERRLARTRAALSAFARRRDDAPIVEAIHWHRIVVDEMHEVVSSPRSLKCLRSSQRRGAGASPRRPTCPVSRRRRRTTGSCNEKRRTIPTRARSCTGACGSSRRLRSTKEEEEEEVPASPSLGGIFACPSTKLLRRWSGSDARAGTSRSRRARARARCPKS